MEQIIAKNDGFYAKEKIIFKGVSLHDPFLLLSKELQDPQEILERIKEDGFNVVRIPILPGHFLAIENYIEQHICPLVNACLQLELYCILDWHAIGNPIKHETRLQEQYHPGNPSTLYYDTNLEECKNAWKKIAQIFGKEPHVLFEIFNEPAPGEKGAPQLGLSPLFWNDWKPEAEEIVSSIRKYSKNCIIISPTRWAYTLKDVLVEPIKIINVCYSIHPYPIRKDWKEIITPILGKYPLIITEWGFKEKTSQEFMKGTKKEYALPLMKFCTTNKISWIAWCYSATWGPQMLQTWKPKDYTPYGKFVIEQLQ
jgi:endoglucanase